MIAGLIRASLRHRWIVLAAAATLLGVGLWRAGRMPVDVFPDVSAPRVTIVTESTGMAAEEVEQLLTYPIETSVNGVTGVRRVRSASAPGISIVWAEFDWDTDPIVARQRVSERLQAVRGALPPDAMAPILAPPSSVMGEILFVALTSDEADAMELRRVADVQVRRRLLAVRGVSQVVAIGGHERQYQVRVDPQKLERFEVTLSTVTEALERGNENASGGYVVESGQESVVRVLGRAHGVADLQRITIAERGGEPVRVEHVADVRVGPAVRRGTGSYNAEPAVVLSVVKQPGGDTLDITERVDRTLDQLEPSLEAQGIALHRDLMRQSEFIHTAVDNLLEVLRDGAILVVLVLMLFLWSVRPTIISALAIPLSLLAAVLAMDALGMSLDTMTLGGLAIAIGALVDDAIVDVENVTRRLRERAALPTGERTGVLETVFRASLEIRPSIVSATLVIMLVFLPLLFLEGLEGRLLEPLAVAYLLAIGASLVVAITVTPVLCLVLLPRGMEKRAEQGKDPEPPPLRWLHRGYEPLLRLSLRRPAAVVAGGVAVVALGAAGLFGLGRSFLPQFNEGSLTIAAVTGPGTSLEQSDALATMAERALLEDPAVISTSRRTGRAERSEHVQGPESSEIDVQLRSDERTREELFEDVRERLSSVPGMQFNVGQPISHRIDHMVSGQRAALSIKVVGDDLGLLRRKAERVRAAVEDVPGLVDLRVEQMVDIPQIVARVDEEAVAQYGMSPGQAASAIGTALWGERAGRIYEDGIATEVVVRFSDEAREDLEAVRSARVPTPSGALVPASALAAIERDVGPNYVLREDVRRRVVVSANVSGRDLRSAYEEIRQHVGREVEVPEGIHIEYAGQFEREEATGKRLLWLSLLVVVGIALIVGTTLGSTRRTVIVLANMPLALAGGVAGVYLSGGVLSVASMIGFITLFGIATRNGILLATRARDLELEGVPRQDAVERASRERLAPILMTALTAALGLLPLALALGQPGSEIQAPMAIVILCGLVTSTALNMMVVPPLLARWGGPTSDDEGTSSDRGAGGGYTNGPVGPML